MELKMEIICKNFEQKQIIDNKIHVNDNSEEYYIIPLTKSFDMESDDEVFKLTFLNQLLWLKYSNHKKELLLKEYDFKECVVIKSDEVLDIYVKINNIHNCFRKNVWFCDNNFSMNKKYLNKYVLALPIIEDMIHINKYGIGIINYQVEMITNEIILKKAKDKGNHNCYIILTNNFLLNKEALFIKLSDDDVKTFLG